MSKKLDCKKSVNLFVLAMVLCLTALILTFPSRCLSFAADGLNLWFQKMIPALFPFMVLSGIMIRMNLTSSFMSILKPVLKPVFRLKVNCLYAIFMGFLCGFPMGAHVTAQLYERNRVSKKEASFLLAFCNSIGPVYFVSFVLPTIGINRVIPALFGMYGIPLLYGLFLRYFLYERELSLQNEKLSGKAEENQTGEMSFLSALDDSVAAAISGITRLGGYMIFFNLLNIFPFLLFSSPNSWLFAPGLCKYAGCLLEITGGIQAMAKENPVFVLCILPFGGFSCIAQTYSMIQHTDLSLTEYVMHKMIITAICVFYYLFLF